MMKIPLSRGLEATVDDADYERLSAFKWHANLVTCGRFYAARKVKVGKNKWTVVYMHHDVLPKERGLDTDHFNGNSLDNRRENLRHVNRSTNIANRTDADTRGVFFCSQTQRWAARLSMNGKRRFLGRFDTKEEALAVLIAERGRVGITAQKPDHGTADSN